MDPGTHKHGLSVADVGTGEAHDAREGENRGPPMAALDDANGSGDYALDADISCVSGEATTWQLGDL